jgi:hypothetical protein
VLQTRSQAQEAYKGSYSFQVAVCLVRLGCILGSFLYQGCLAVVDWSLYTGSVADKITSPRSLQRQLQFPSCSVSSTSGCILGSFLYQGCLAVVDWSPLLAANIERKALIRLAQAANFLLSGGLLSRCIARVMRDKERILYPFLTPVDWIDFLGEQAVSISLMHIAGMLLVRVLDSSVQGNGTKQSWLFESQNCTWLLRAWRCPRLVDVHRRQECKETVGANETDGTKFCQWHFTTARQQPVWSKQWFSN